ncbi:hypothetical protein RB600_009090 [Gaeumannomyces tritici]
MHVTKIVQAAALLTAGARASSAPASQDSSLEARGVAADMFKFNWHVPKVPTWKELQEPTPRNKKIKESQDKQVAAAAAAAAAAEGKKATRRSVDRTLEARGVAADMFKFNWHVPKVPTWKELQEPTPRNKKIKESQDKQVAAAKAKAAAAAEGTKATEEKKPTRRSIESDEKSKQEEGVEVKRGVAWSA